MKLKSGYKQTEIGVIPEEWSIAPFSELYEFQNGVNADKDAYGSGVPFINVLEVITKGHLKASDIPGKVSLSRSTIESYTVRRGDVVFNRTSETQEEVGLAAVYLEDGPVVFGGFVIRGRPKTQRVNPIYSGYAFRSPSIRTQIIALGQGAIRSNVGQGDLRRILAALPPAPEQSAIAEALSDADALIESLEQLIAKKRMIKQGAMQELLTGKRRLPGFRGEWEERTIAEAADNLDNLRVPLNDLERSSMRGDYPYCGANGILDYIDRYCVEDSVILIAEDGGHFEEYLTRPIAYRMSGKFWVNNHAHILKAKPGYDQDFLYYSLVHKNILSFLASGTRAKLNKSELSKITIRQPIESSEQMAIAIVLSDMDREIDTLESRTAKARDVKLGMMQELLTGRIRLV